MTEQSLGRSEPSEHPLAHYIAHLLDAPVKVSAGSAEHIQRQKSHAVDQSSPELSARQNIFLKRFAAAQLRQSVAVPAAKQKADLGGWLGVRVGGLLLAFPQKQIVYIARQAAVDGCLQSRADGNFVPYPEDSEVLVRDRGSSIDAPESGAQKSNVSVSRKVAELEALLREDSAVVDEQQALDGRASHRRSNDVFLLNPGDLGRQDAERDPQHLVYLGLCGASVKRAKTAICALCVQSIEASFELEFSAITALSPVIVGSMPKWVQDGLVGRSRSIRLGEGLDEPLLLDLQQMQRNRLARQLVLED